MAVGDPMGCQPGRGREPGGYGGTSTAPEAGCGVPGVPAVAAFPGRRVFRCGNRMRGIGGLEAAAAGGVRAVREAPRAGRACLRVGTRGQAVAQAEAGFGACPRCRKRFGANALLHVCNKPSDFKKRRAEHEKRERDKAREKARQERPKHDYLECSNRECKRACALPIRRASRGETEGWARGWQMGYDRGWEGPPTTSKGVQS